MCHRNHLWLTVGVDLWHISILSRVFSEFLYLFCYYYCYYYFPFFLVTKKKIYIYRFSSPSITWIAVNGILNKIFNLSFPRASDNDDGVWRRGTCDFSSFLFQRERERQALNSPWSRAITNQYYRVRTFDVHVHVSIIVSCLKQTLWSTLATKNIREKTYAFPFLRVEKTIREIDIYIYKEYHVSRINSTDRMDTIFINGTSRKIFFLHW